MLGLESNAGPSPIRTRAMKVKKDQSKPKQDKVSDLSVWLVTFQCAQ